MTDIAVRSDQLPDFMKGYAPGAGVEAITSDAIAVPRLALSQALSPQVEAGEARPGEWWHNVAEENLGKEVLLVPCYCTLSYILFRPRASGGGVLARSNDLKTWIPANAKFEVQLRGGKTVTWDTSSSVAKSGLMEWGSEDPTNPKSNPAATAFINVVSYLPDHPSLSPVVLSFSRSGYKIGKKLMAQLKIGRVPSFGRKFIVSSQKVDGEEGPYMEPRFKAHGLIQDQETFSITSSIYETFKTMDFNIVGEDSEEERGEETTEY